MTFSKEWDPGLRLQDMEGEVGREGHCRAWPQASGQD